MSYADLETMPTMLAMLLAGAGFGIRDVGIVELESCFKHGVFGGEIRDEKIANGSATCRAYSTSSGGPLGLVSAGRMQNLDDRAGVCAGISVKHSESAGAIEFVDADGISRHR